MNKYQEGARVTFVDFKSEVVQGTIRRVECYSFKWYYEIVPDNSNVVHRREESEICLMPTTCTAEQLQELDREIVKNLNIGDLTPLEEAFALQVLMNLRHQDAATVAASLGMDEDLVKARLSLLV